jgi:hypothetical protein
MVRRGGGGGNSQYPTRMPMSFLRPSFERAMTCLVLEDHTEVKTGDDLIMSASTFVSVSRDTNRACTISHQPKSQPWWKRQHGSNSNAISRRK